MRCQGDSGGCARKHTGALGHVRCRVSWRNQDLPGQSVGAGWEGAAEGLISGLAGCPPTGPLPPGSARVKVQARSCLPPPPGCYQRGWLSWSSPAGAVPQGSGGALCQGHQEKVGFSGCIQPLLFVMSLTPRGSWRCGSRAGCPGPESRPSHSRLPGLARTWEPPVLPPECPSHRPALSPSCTQAPCPCRGWCRWLRGGSEDPAHTSTGRWAPSTWQGQERPCWNQPRWKSLQVKDEVTALGTLTGRLPGQGGVPCSCRAGRL